MTKIPVAIDASVLIAITDHQDKQHSAAIALRDALIPTDTRAVFFDCVFNEAISVIGRRAEEQKRSDQFDALLNKLVLAVPTENITWIAAEGQRLFTQILELCRRTQGALNYHDALITLVCQELDIPYIVSFDLDFDSVSWLKRIGSAAETKLLMES